MTPERNKYTRRLEGRGFRNTASGHLRSLEVENLPRSSSVRCLGLFLRTVRHPLHLTMPRYFDSALPAGYLSTLARRNALLRASGVYLVLLCQVRQRILTSNDPQAHCTACQAGVYAPRVEIPD